MKLHYFPLLQILFELYSRPRDMKRFRDYLHKIFDWKKEIPEIPPLLIANPMAKPAVAEFVKTVIDLGADALAEKIIAQMSSELDGIAGTFNVTLIVADDVGGGWSNKAELDYKNRVACVAPCEKVTWVTGIIWVSEEPSLQKIGDELRTSLYRLAYVTKHGQATTLREFLAQEGYAMSMAGCRQPILDQDDLEYTRSIIQPLLDSTDMPTHIACLYGDAVAKAFGFTAYGLSPNAGFSLALHDVNK